MGGLSKAAALVIGVTLLVAGAGCGGTEGVDDGGTVTAYVVQPLCAEAERELKREGGRAGDLHVKAVCLPSGNERGKLNLSAIGANARRAIEDSTAVAYLEPPEPAAARFTHPILESAEIAWISTRSGSTVMADLLRMIRESDSSSLRESVRQALG